MPEATDSGASSGRRPVSRRRKALFLLIVYGTFFALLEITLRVFAVRESWDRSLTWTPAHTRTVAGNKGWPGARCLMYSREFNVPFAYDDLGYRAREGNPLAAATRLAFVGDSLTEALQVPERETFVAGVEARLRQHADVRCDNLGVSGTGPFDYYHRLRHDVLPKHPTAVVLCLFPGNDFTDPFPRAGFAADGALTPDYFKPYNVGETALAWLISHSKVGYGFYRGLVFLGKQLRGKSELEKSDWWAAVPLAPATLANPEVQQRFSVLRQIEQLCAAEGVPLVVLVIGPDPGGYRRIKGKSPVEELLRAAGVRAPVLDVASEMDRERDEYMFPWDQHPTARGHAFIAARAAPFLERVLGLDTTKRPSNNMVSRSARVRGGTGREAGGR